MSDVPASVLRRRELFARIREDVKRLNVDGSGLTEKTEAEIIKDLEDLERHLEYVEVLNLGREYCDQLARDAATMPLPSERDDR